MPEEKAAPGYKIILSWDIAPNHEQEYFEFVTHHLIPELQKMGIELGDAWATVFGEQPQIMVTAGFRDLVEARKFLHSTAWRDLKNDLLDFVKDYEQKIVEARGGFQF
jgi:hypothetical protein